FGREGAPGRSGEPPPGGNSGPPTVSPRDRRGAVLSGGLVRPPILGPTPARARAARGGPGGGTNRSPAPPVAPDRPPGRATLLRRSIPSAVLRRARGGTEWIVIGPLRQMLMMEG